MDEVGVISSEEIAARLKHARIVKGMSQADLASKAGITLSLVSDIEHCKSKMRLETFLKVIQALDVSADSIVRMEEAPVLEDSLKEIKELLADCTVAEYQSIVDIVGRIKNAMRMK